MTSTPTLTGFRRFLSRKKLTIPETRSFFREVSLANEGPIFVLGLKYGLVNRFLDPDLSLIQLIDITKDRSQRDLLPIGECLRYGANPNMYVEAPGLSNHIHILGYAFDKVRSLPERTGYPDTALALMIYAGADLNKPIFDPNFGGIRKESDYYAPDSGRSTGQWIAQQGYPLVLEYQAEGLATKVPRRQIEVLSILMDYAAEVDKSKTRQENNLYIKSLGEKLLPKLTPLKESNYYINLDLLDCINYLNAPAFKYLVSSGLVPAFPVVNEILLLARSFKAQQYLFAMDAMLEMLQATVSTGYDLTSDQRLLLTGVSDAFQTKKLTQEKQPYWEKACSSTSTEVPLRLLQLAAELNIPISGSKTMICNRMRDFAKRDPKELKEAAVRRSRERMNITMGFLDDFISGTPQGITCENGSLIRGNPHEYADVDLSFYRNASGKVYCYTSDQYASLLETKVSPETQEPLPVAFLEELKFKADLLKKLQLSRPPQKISDAIDQLSQADTLDTEIVYTWEPMKRRLFEDLAKKGISSERLNQITPVAISELLRKYGINGNVGKLTPSHARDTLIWILDWLSKYNPEVYSKILTQL